MPRFLLCALLAGCSPAKAPRGTVPKPPAPVAPAPPPAAVVDKTVAVPTVESVRREAARLLADWKAAQNAGDAGAYFALYHPTRFKGLKRTHRGKRNSYSFEAWRSDRGTMFKKPFEIAVESETIATWLEPDAELKPGLTRVRFLQRWRNDSYADHGPKTLLLWRDPRLGRTTIVFEELLLSRPGWDEAEAAVGKRFPTLSQAATVAEMTEALRSLHLGMKSAPEVALELSDPFHRGLLLQAAASFGSLDCFTGISYEECGSPAQDFGAVEDATIEHACVRRALLLPLLAGAPVQPEALTASSAQLLPLLDVPEDAVRDEEFGRAVLHAVASLPEAKRVPYLRAALRRPDWDVAEWLHGVRAPTLYALWQHTHNPAALKALPVSEHAARIARIHANDTPLPHDVLLPAVRQLSSAQHRALLDTFKTSADCALAMTALVQLGQPEALPSWQSATDEAHALRAICLLQHDPDKERASRELSKFFHPTHRARLVEVEDREGDTYYDEGSSDEEPADKAPDPQALRSIAEASALIHAPEASGTRTASISTLERPAPDSLLNSQAFKEDGDDTRDFELIQLIPIDGHYYVDYLGRYTYTWYGCPC